MSPQLRAKLTTLLTIISLPPELRAQLTPQWTFRVIIKVLGKTFGYKALIISLEWIKETINLQLGKTGKLQLFLFCYC